MAFDITPYVDMSPKKVRELIRKGVIDFPTAGMCRGYAQANMDAGISSMTVRISNVRNENLFLAIVPQTNYRLKRQIVFNAYLIQLFLHFLLCSRCCIYSIPARSIFFYFSGCFFHPFNKSLTKRIHPILPTPAKNTKPIKIMILLGLAGLKGTVAGCTTV